MHSIEMDKYCNSIVRTRCRKLLNVLLLSMSVWREFVRPICRFLQAIWDSPVSPGMSLSGM